MVDDECLLPYLYVAVTTHFLSDGSFGCGPSHRWIIFQYGNKDLGRIVILSYLRVKFNMTCWKSAHSRLTQETYMFTVGYDYNTKYKVGHDAKLGSASLDNGANGLPVQKMEPACPIPAEKAARLLR